jgi:hypothetical protein
MTNRKSQDDWSNAAKGFAQVNRITGVVYEERLK